MQMLSGSADGLVRLWNVGSGESINTFDQHNDKVWSLDAPSDADLSAAASGLETRAGTVVMMMTRLCLFLKAFLCPVEAILV